MNQFPLQKSEVEFLVYRLFSEILPDCHLNQIKSYKFMSLEENGAMIYLMLSRRNNTNSSCCLI